MQVNITLFEIILNNINININIFNNTIFFSFNFIDDLLKFIPISTQCKWFSNVLSICQHKTSVTTISSIHLFSFALKYLAILVRSNDALVALIEAHTLKSMINQTDVFSLKESSVFNAYISLLQSLNSQKSGLEYIFQEGNKLFWFLVT